MRADYATSDLISKVNSDWINEVLANPEFGRAGHRRDIPGEHVPGDQVLGDQVPGDQVPADDGVVSDLRLRREFARKRTILLQRGSTSVGRHEPDIAIEPMARSSRPRSVARRVNERLALAVAAMAVVWVAVWMALEPQDAANSESMGATNASLEPSVSINANEPGPGWLLPEILYGPARASSPISVPRSGR
jgi:hypothetical protein